MRRITLAISALALGLPASAAAQDIIVSDIGSAQVSYANGNTPKIRRGVTSHVKIIKHLIDLVPFQLVSVSGGGTISSLSNGRTSGGTGFIAMNVTVPSNQAPNSIITLNVGLSDKYNLRVTHRGLVSSITAAPQPATLVGGTPWVATVRGTDLGDAVVDLGSNPCHTTAVVGNRTADSIRFTLTKATNCTINSFSLSLDPSAADDPPKYVLSSGATPVLNFSYIPPPPSGVVCSSTPNLQATTIRQPVNNQVINFGAGTASPTNVTLRWDSLTVISQPVPNNEWIVSRMVAPGKGTTGGPAIITNAATTRTVRGLSTAFSLAIPGTYTFSVKAKNCDQGAAQTTVTFSLQYQ